MSDRIEGTYKDATPNVKLRETRTERGHPIQYLVFGYEIDSLSSLFPIFITHNAGRQFYEVQESVVEFVSGSPEFSVCAPGVYDPPPEEENTGCHIKFFDITPETHEEVDDVTDAQAIRLAKQFKADLENGGNPYRDTRTTDNGKFVVFFLDIGRGHRITLPFPTSRPLNSEDSEQLQTKLPCYIITSADRPPERGELPNKELVTLRWSYPLLE
jgi:hypothetical protein